jgi:hypothetical protein
VIIGAACAGLASHPAVLLLNEKINRLYRIVRGNNDHTTAFTRFECKGIGIVRADPESMNPFGFLVIGAIHPCQMERDYANFAYAG